MIVVLNDSADKSIENVIHDFCKKKHIDYVQLSSADFLNQSFQIYDRLDQCSTKVNWVTPTGVNISNSENTIIINLLDFISVKSLNGFHPDDVEYIRQELFAYLIFSTTQFKYGISTPSGNSLSNKYISMPLQWAKLEASGPEYRTPDYFYSDFIFFKSRLLTESSEKWICGDLHSFRCWKPSDLNKLNHEDQRKYLFYKRPSGEPFLAFGFGDQVCIKPLNEKHSFTDSHKIEWENQVKECAKILNVFCYECIFFIDEGKFTFGSLSSDITATKEWPEFSGIIEKFLERPAKCLSWTRAKNRRQISACDQNQETLNIVCGTPKDSCINVMRHDSKFNSFEFLEITSLERSWNYAVTNGQLHIRNNSGLWRKCSSFYIRPIDIDESSAYQIFSNFYEILNSLKIPFIGASENMQLNGTKPTQLLTSLQAIESNSILKIPSTYIISGPWSFVEELLKKHDSLIVKSLSGIRSHVVDDSIFTTWPRENLQFAPQMFQEKISGSDLRVHVCGDFVEGRMLKYKSGTDYRYAKNRSEFEEIALPKPLKDLSIELSQSVSTGT